MDTTNNRVKAIIADLTDVKIEDIKDSTNISEDLGTDSLDNVEIIMNVEKEFGISIPDEEASRPEMLVVSNIVACVERLYQPSA